MASHLEGLENLLQQVTQKDGFELLLFLMFFKQNSSHAIF